MKVLEGVLLNKLFYRLCFRVFTAHKFGASFGRRLPFIAYLSTTAHKGPFESIQNMPIMPYYDMVCSSMTLSFPPLGFTWMGNPKAALESKAAVTVVMI